MKKTRHSMRRITGRYIGRPFSEMPCLELVCRVYADLGVPLPETWQGITRADWFERWRAEPRKLENLLLRFAETLGAPADVAHLKRWDLVICIGQTRAIFPSVYLGRRHMLTSAIREGVVVAPVKTINRPLLARRVYHG